MSFQRYFSGEICVDVLMTDIILALHMSSLCFMGYGLYDDCLFYGTLYPAFLVIFL